MAARNPSNDADSLSNNSIVRQLLSRIDELSEAISTPVRANNETESEVRRVFTGGRGVNPTQSALPTQSRATESENSTERRLPVGRQRAFEMRRNFQGQRPSPLSRRPRNTRPSYVDNKPFMRDLILLGGPDDVVVPRQGTRLALMENGHVISGCKFTKAQTEAQVETTIIEAFDGKIPAGVDIELFMSMHTTLVKPTLAPGQRGIDGAIIQRLYRNKPVYVRPDRPLLDLTQLEIAQQQGQKKQAQPPNEIPPGNDDPQMSGEDDALIEVLRDAEEQQAVQNHVTQEIVDEDPLVEVLQQDQEEVHVQNEITEPIYVDVLPQDTPSPSIQIDEVHATETKEVIVHRTTIRQDVIDIFGDPNILNFILNFTVIDAHGHAETGKGKGVSLDILTQFWQEFFTVFATGGVEKTPHIRHDLQKPQWQSIARVIVYGYRTVQYFPLKLSQLFIIACLFGEENVTNQFLLKSFRCYVVGDDRDVLDTCLSKEFDPSDEDVLEFLSMMKCYRVPKQENIEAIIFELAHQELLQKPRYIQHCWSPVLKSLQADSAFQTLEGVAELYESKRPTAKKLNKLFRAEVSNDAERQCLEHLKRYVKSLEGKALERFLHFTTGSDVLVCESIEVLFTSLDGFQRRPVVHTCGPMLELPSTYECYSDLAEEFTNIMREDTAWSFDIV